MRKYVCLALTLALAAALCACFPEPKYPETEPTASIVIEPAPVTIAPETTIPEPVETELTTPEHSDLDLPGVDVESVIIWFNEVVLDSEFSHGGNSSLVQKWTMPIAYSLEGERTDEDIQVLEDFTAWLNTIEGFPGIHPAAEDEYVNLRICFGDAQMILDRLGPEYENVDGGVRYWYENNEIYDESICYLTGISQHARNSVILEEIYNGLGLVQDTNLREDSLIWQGYSEPQSLTQVDELLVKLLYHPDMQCGMNAQECETVIRELYY